METMENQEEFEALPLKLAYKFLENNNLTTESNEIRLSQDQYKSYRATLKRGKIISLLKKNNLLDSFIDIHWAVGKTDRGLRKILRYEKILNAFLGDNKEEEAQESSEEEGIEETSFAMEEHLKAYLLKDLSVIEHGLILWKDKNGNPGIEYRVDEDDRRIDILGIDKNNVPVVIELKVSRGYQKVIGQCLYYKNRVKELLHSPQVRIVIVAREISPELKIATLDLPDVKLFEYRISFSVQPID
jgi:hypothetical protein